MSETRHILIVDDSPEDAEILAMELEEGPHPIEWQRVDTEPDLRTALSGDIPWQAVLCDFSMPQLNPLTALEVVQALADDLPVIIISGVIRDIEAIDLLDAGARDFLEKRNLVRLRIALQREIMAREARGQRRLFEEKLKHNEAHFRTLFQHAPIALMEADFSKIRADLTRLQDRGVDDWDAHFEAHPDQMAAWLNSVSLRRLNQAAITLYQARGQDHLQARMHRLHTVEYLALFGQVLRAFLAGQESCSGEVTHSNLAGEKMWIHVTFTLTPGRARRWRRVIIAVQDLTERHRQEEDLSRYTSIVAASDDHMALLGRDYRYMAVNDAYIAAHGKSRREIVGHTVAELLGKKQFKKRVKPLLDRCLEGRTVTYQAPFEFSAWEKPRWMDVHYHPYRDAGGKIAGVVVVSRDITGLKHMEEQLVAAKESAEAGNRAKSQFLANMSHEIRSPMNAIIGMTDLALNTELESKEQKNMLKIVQQSSYALLELINDILDYSKIEAGHVQLEIIPFDLFGQVNKLCETMAVKAHEKGLELYSDLHCYLPVTLLGDPFRLRQVLVNLVGNAIKFTDHGEVVVRIRTVAEPENRDSQYFTLHFSVHDTGMGIPDDQKKRIFERFTQMDGAMTRKHGGTGLGLTISTQLVGMMNGKIWVPRFHRHCVCWISIRRPPL
ncbi:MAG: PAS domain-containing protein [Magnetococcales bacterium]|nr:PAS domain-containing protein [Magnetococcales bacterium]